MNIKEYKTVWAEKAEEFDREVNDFLDKGWELYGQPYSVADGGTGEEGHIHGYHCQALTFTPEA